ncbi:MAG TPA: alpha-amylase family glycosyl hydrolase [Candidatus Saccharimonadales bacterium]|nr:alpha-amylase family glycosyl hydrolase [Candidatus Saccharimonadales bacterium]
MAKNTKKNVGAIFGKTGVTFRVWAPFASNVAVTGSFNGWSQAPMAAEADGHWSTFVRGARAGQEYQFVIQNGKDTFYRNDPRARHFPTTAGSSVIVDPWFDWGDDAFTPPPVEQQVIYEIHVGTFYRPDLAITGTFYDVCDKLDYLADLGVNMIELMPISTMLMDRGWGYAIDYIFAVESLYGGRRGFLQFVKAAHQRGIGVILDVVYNHFGPDSEMDLWQFDGWHDGDMGGIYFYNDWRAATPWGNTRPDFGRAEVQQYILDNVAMWMHECRVDGLRVDSTIYIRNVHGSNNDPANDLPEGWQLLQNINGIAKKINPHAITIGEDVADNEYIVKAAGEGGAGFSAQWELGFPYALREALHSDDPAQINLTGICGELTRRYNGDVFSRIVFTNSHDSASNGSARMNEQLSPGKSDNTFARSQSLLAATLTLTAPGVPMLFQGEEFMQPGSFNDWEGLDWRRTEAFAGIVDAYQHLVALRKNSGGVSAGLSGQGMNLMHVDEMNKVIAYHRWNAGGPHDDVVVLINFSKQQCNDYVLSFPGNGVWKVRFNSSWHGYSTDFRNVAVPDVLVENGGGTVVVPAGTALVFSQDS